MRSLPSALSSPNNCTTRRLSSLLWQLHVVFSGHETSFFVLDSVRHGQIVSLSRVVPCTGSSTDKHHLDAWHCVTLRQRCDPMKQVGGGLFSLLPAVVVPPGRTRKKIVSNGCFVSRDPASLYPQVIHVKCRHNAQPRLQERRFVCVLSLG